MSEISIPGISNTGAYDKLLEKLMEVERIPLKRMEKRVASHRKEVRSWRKLSGNISRLRRASEVLFGFENPFDEKKTSTSEPSLLRATASREAEVEEIRVRVLQKARADHRISRPFPLSYRVPEGVYLFSIGEKELRLRYPGGPLSDFSHRINKIGKGLLETQVIRKNRDQQVILFRSQKTGAKNRLSFGEAALPFASEGGLVANQGAIDSFPRPSKPLILVNPQQPLTVNPGEKTSVELSSPQKVSPGDTLLFDLQIEKAPTSREFFLPPPPGFTLENVTVESAGSVTTLPSPPPPPLTPSANWQPFFLATGDGDAVVLPPVPGGEGSQHLSLSVPPGLTRFDRILVDNSNDGILRLLKVSYKSGVEAPLRKGGGKSASLSTAADAIISLNGVEVQREENTMKNLLPGLTLEILGEGEKEVLVEVSGDKEIVKRRILEFVQTYNELLTKLNILGSRNEIIIDELDYLSTEEREEAETELGLLKGELTLLQLKNLLQRLATEAYPVSTEVGVGLLVNLGISTNASWKSGAFLPSKLRGYLEVDEELLDKALATMDKQFIKDLFGSDTDGDLIIDSGVAFAVDENLTAYDRRGGVVSQKTDGLDRKIREQSRKIENYNGYLRKHEKELRAKYATVEGLLKQLEEGTKALDSLRPQE